MQDLSIYGVALVPLIVGVVELVKRLEVVPQKFLPLVAVILGLGGGLLVYWGDWAQAGVVGLSLGLAAVGLYSGVKNVREGVEG